MGRMYQFYSFNCLAQGSVKRSKQQNNRPQTAGRLFCLQAVLCIKIGRFTDMLKSSQVNLNNLKLILCHTKGIGTKEKM